MEARMEKQACWRWEKLRNKRNSEETFKENKRDEKEKHNKVENTNVNKKLVESTDK